MAKPKSANFGIAFWNKILAGLISLWIISKNNIDLSITLLFQF